MMRTFFILVLLACAALVGCASEHDVASGTAADAIATRSNRASFRRVVLGRIYQHEEWTLPAADTYRPDLYARTFDRRVAYVCDAYASLEPTYVSGLLRFDQDEAITDTQVATFKAIRSCIRERVKGHEVVFDVVLNALQYSDPDTIASDAQGVQLLETRLADVEAKLGPDLYFFDFFTVPYNKHDKEWRKDVITAGMTWIHGHRALVGGNVWGKKLPPGTDFGGVDDSGGLDDVEEQVTAIARTSPGVPLMIHVRNDPHVPGSEGLKFIAGDAAYRLDVIQSESALARELGQSYMLPVFFPLRIDGPRRIAYDANVDGLLDDMRKTAP